MIRVAFLWSNLSGYLNACLKELASRDGVELLVSHQAPGEEAPFDESQFAWMRNSLTWRTLKDLDALPQRIRAFSPDIMITAGWHIPPYRRLARKYAGKCWRVMAFDNPWDGTVKQRLGRLIAPFHLHPAADVAWVPGERQAIFARKMGFAQRAIVRGSLSCDRDAFEAAHLARLDQKRPVPQAFIYAGRLSPEKGVTTLASAYEKYRRAVRDPWPLICCGTGALRSQLDGKFGIRLEGFIQPKNLAGVMAGAGCLIVPSDWDHWGVVVHEAASGGLLILTSEDVGAAVHLVQPNFNGYIFGKRDAAALAGLMARVSAMSNERLDAMSRASYLLSEQYSPIRWADALLDSFAERSQTRSSLSPVEGAVSTFNMN